MEIREFFTLEKENDISIEYLLERFRNWRAEELKNTDWTQLPDSPTDKLAWVDYRQKLRDLPKEKNFPEAVLPIKPNA